MSDIRWNEEELQKVVRAIPVATLKNEKKLESYFKEQGWNKIELAAVLTVVLTAVPDFRKITLSGENEITFGEFYDYHERAQVQFIIIHRVNYIMHQAMITVYDLLEKNGSLKFMVKKNHLEAEKVWRAYEEPRRKQMEKEAWYTMQDHLRISYDILSPRLEKVYETIRDYMIRLGWKNIEVKARIETALLVAKVAKHSFRAFFKEFEESCGCDFSKGFKYADLHLMVKYFSQMSESLGFVMTKDKYGLPDIDNFDCDANQRVKWAWQDFIKDLQDNDLMDESALRAINLNPKVAEDYHKLIAEEEQQQMDKSVDKLSEKFKVTKKK